VTGFSVFSGQKVGKQVQMEMDGWPFMTVDNFSFVPFFFHPYVGGPEVYFHVKILVPTINLQDQHSLVLLKNYTTTDYTSSTGDYQLPSIEEMHLLD
jgi:hypothetical protein